eukprot:751054-Hanusia_phi.AAC.6
MATKEEEEEREEQGTQHTSELDDLPSSLIVIVDLNQESWIDSTAKGGPSVIETLESLLTFLRAFFMLHGGNTVTIIAAHPYGSEFLYQSPALQRSKLSAHQPSGALEMDEIDQTLHERIVSLSKKLKSKSSQETSKAGFKCSLISSAFALAACTVNRISSQKVNRMLPRVLVLTASTELPSQYIPIMNSIFSMQKANVLIDALVVSDSDCSFLQQAADITNGVYLRPDLSKVGGTSGALLSWMISVFLGDKHTRFLNADSQSRSTLLRLPQAQDVDYRSSCFKTGQMVDVGFVCSVCLSIFAKCDFFICPTCDSKIALDRPAGAAVSKKRKVAAAAAQKGDEGK